LNNQKRITFLLLTEVENYSVINGKRFKVMCAVAKSTYFLHFIVKKQSLIQ